MKGGILIGPPYASRTVRCSVSVSVDGGCVIGPADDPCKRLRRSLFIPFAPCAEPLHSLSWRGSLFRGMAARTAIHGFSESPDSRPIGTSSLLPRHVLDPRRLVPPSPHPLPPPSEWYRAVVILREASRPAEAVASVSAA